MKDIFGKNLKVGDIVLISSQGGQLDFWRIVSLENDNIAGQGEQNGRVTPANRGDDFWYSAPEAHCMVKVDPKDYLYEKLKGTI